MINSIFFLYCALFIVTYGLQNVLQARYIRKYDALSVGIYRNISLVVTMAPLLLFVPLEKTLAVLQHPLLLLSACVTGAAGLLGAFLSAHYLPIGVGSALRHMSHTITAVLLGAYLFGEFLNPFQLLFLGFAAAAGIALILSKVDYGHLDTKMVGRGMVITLFAGIAVAFSFYFFSALSRIADPFAVAYFWEAGIGICLFLYFLARKFAFGEKLQHPSRRDSGIIIGIALLTVVGTAAYAFAVNNGPYALASGLMNLTTVIAIILGPYMFKERLTRMQLSLVLFAVLCTILLRLVS